MSTLQAHAADAEPFGTVSSEARPGRGSFDVNSASFAATAVAGASRDGREPAYYTPAAVAAVGGTLNALLGFARTSLNAPIPYARVVLRNIQTDQVLARTTADEHGQVSFLDLEPSAYVIELLGADGAVLAASPLVTISRGDVQQTIVRVPTPAATVSASLGNTLEPTLPQAITVATSNDVTRTTATQAAQASPR